MSRQKTLASGHTVEAVDDPERSALLKDFPGYKEGLVRLNPGRWLMPSGFLQFADKLYDFEFRKGDVLVMTWPKCGTTWTQEIVWMMKNDPDLKNPDSDLPIMDRVPFMEVDMFIPPTDPEIAASTPLPEMFKRLCPGADPQDGINFQLARATPSPRSLKTHLPFSFFKPSMLEDVKVIYVARNPKDTMLSYLHHHRLLMAQNFTGTLEAFTDYFVEDNLVYGPYWLHLKEAWEKRDHPNLHFVFYEDMKADIMGELKKMDAFLGTQLTQQQLENVAKYTSFGEMKNRNNFFFSKDFFKNKTLVNQTTLEKDGGFFRQGKSGAWKNKLAPELANKVDEWIKENCNFGINFD